MQRILIALFLCGALAFGSVWSERAVDDALGAVTANIEAGEVGQAHEKWEQAQTLLGSLLLHTEVDQATACLTASSPQKPPAARLIFSSNAQSCSPRSPISATCSVLRSATCCKFQKRIFILVYFAVSFVLQLC